jgi:GntR family transcriptional regulator, rspAB operon transcriptional repressor
MSAVPSFQFDPTRHAGQQVLESLREAIMSMQLAPGSALDRNQLAEQFGVSQTPVRDALMRLSEEGLVVVRPQHATLVSKIDVAAAREAHFLRRSLELEIVRDLATQARESDLDGLRTQLALQKTLAARQDYRGFVAADKEFHRLTYVAAGMPRLWGLVQRMSGHVDRLRLLHLPTAGKTESIMRDHRAVVDAIARRDPDGAQAALRQHLSGTLASVDDIRRRHPDFLLNA